MIRLNDLPGEIPDKSVVEGTQTPRIRLEAVQRGSSVADWEPAALRIASDDH